MNLVKRIGIFKDNLKIAVRAIRSNKVRAILTMCIIAFGIMALVGILTAIDAIKSSLTSQFTMMGANSFTITSRGMNIQAGNERKRMRNHSTITYRQAMEFRKMFNEPAWVSISFNATSMSTVKYGSEETNPNVSLVGVDDNYLAVSGYEIEKGRNFSPDDIEMNRRLVLLGSDIVSNLFPSGLDPVGQDVSLAGLKLQVAGVLKSKGASQMSDDNICLMPVSTARQYFSRPNMNFNITIMPLNPVNLDVLAGQAEGVFRVVRNLAPKDESDFNIVKSDTILNMLLKNIRYVTLAATLIGVITLFGAAVGLMNIMLVSVTERTREIGIRKAVGATKKTIRNQFLAEAIVIAQFGGIIGIILGILAGNALGAIIGSGFIIPWLWIIGGVILCFLVALVSGILPATKAANLEPVDSLRYE